MMRVLVLKKDGMDKKSKAIFWLKLIGVIIAAVIGFLTGTLTSCSSVSSFSMTADTLYMDNPVISVKDSTNIKSPF